MLRGKQAGQSQTYVAWFTAVNHMSPLTIVATQMSRYHIHEQRLADFAALMIGDQRGPHAAAAAANDCGAAAPSRRGGAGSLAGGRRTDDEPLSAATTRDTESLLLRASTHLDSLWHNLGNFFFHSEFLHF